MQLWFRISNSRIGMALAATTMGLIAIGCGDGDFVPPPPQELVAAERGNAPGLVSASSANSRPIGAESAGARSIDVILNPELDVEVLKLESGQARMQAGFDNVRIRLPFTGEDSESASPGGSAAAPKSQAALVREALARDPRPPAIVIEPSNPADPDLAKAVQEARAAKVPVILVGRPLAGGAGAEGAAAGPTPILVTSQSFAESARQLVAAAIRNAKNAKLKPEGGAVFLINTASDDLLPDRIAAVRSALESAGIRSIQELRFARDSQAAQKVLDERLKADPKLALVFSFDFSSSTGSNLVAGEIVLERPFIQAGYTSEDNLIRMATGGEFAAIAIYVPTRLVRKAISLAVDLAKKSEVPNKVEIPVEVHESPPTSGAPHFQAEMKTRKQESKSRE